MKTPVLMSNNSGSAGKQVAIRLGLLRRVGSFCSMDGGGEGSSLSASQNTVDFTGDRATVVDLTGKVHQLPCCIKYDGPTSVSHYFKPKTTGTVYECTTDICIWYNT